MEQIVCGDRLRLAWPSVPTMCALYPGTTSTNRRSMVMPTIELEVLR
jgi:hypothetical protein